MKSTYLYLRVSDKSQLNGHGLDRQEEACRTYATKAGYEVAGVYREEGISGTADETARPAFQEMMAEILKDGVTVIIVESLDRLAREYRIQEHLLIYLVSKGVDLIAANTEENVTQAIQADPMKKALVQMQGIFSELDKSMLVKKLRKARDAASKEAGRRVEGRPRYGDTPEEQAIIRRMIAMRRTRRGGYKGMTFQAIADRLNAEGNFTRSGAPWQAAGIFQVLGRKK